jgi:FeS assembly protein IscX
MPKLQWTDADEIGYLLAAKFPDQDPLAVRFTDLRARVMALNDFAGDPSASNEKVLEAVQMAWLEYYQERKSGG